MKKCKLISLVGLGIVLFGMGSPVFATTTLGSGAFVGFKNGEGPIINVDPEDGIRVSSLDFAVNEITTYLLNVGGVIQHHNPNLEGERDSALPTGNMVNYIENDEKIELLRLRNLRAIGQDDVILNIRFHGIDRLRGIGIEMDGLAIEGGTNKPDLATGFISLSQGVGVDLMILRTQGDTSINVPVKGVSLTVPSGLAYSEITYRGWITWTVGTMP
jgi:hypothetical protein